MNAFNFRSNNSEVIELKFIIHKKDKNSTEDLLRNIKNQIYEKEDRKILLSVSMTEGDTTIILSKRKNLTCILTSYYQKELKNINNSFSFSL